MKKFIKLIFIISIFSVLIAILSNSKVLATNMIDYIGNAANASATGNAITTTENIAGSVITIVKVITASVALIMLIILGIKYMSSAPGDKAEIKKHAVVYVVGAVIMFSVTGILTIIQNFADGI